MRTAQFFLLALAEQAAAPAAPEGGAFAAALRISGIALLAIFVVMGLFALVIAVLARLFPDDNPNGGQQ